MRERETECDREREGESDNARERKLIFKRKYSNTQPSKTPINNTDIKTEVQKKNL